MKKHNIIEIIIVLAFIILFSFYFYNKNQTNIEPNIQPELTENIFMRTANDLNLWPKILEVYTKNSSSTSFITLWPMGNKDLINSMKENTSMCPDAYYISSNSSTTIYSKGFFLTPNCIYISVARDEKTFQLNLIAKDSLSTFKPLFYTGGFANGSDLSDYFIYKNTGHYLSSTEGVIDIPNFKEAVGNCNKIEYGPIYVYYPSSGGYIINQGKKTEVPDSICSGDVENGLFKGDTKAYYIFGTKNSGGIEVNELPSLNPAKTTKVGSNLYTDGVNTVRIDAGNGADGTFWSSVDKVDIADISTYKELGPQYAVDSVNVYYGGKVIVGADSKTFKVLYDEPGGFEGYAVSIGRDDNALWSEDNKIMDVAQTTEITFSTSSEWTDRGLHFTDGEFNYTYGGPGDLKKIKI